MDKPYTRENNEFIAPVFAKKKKHDFKAYMTLRKTIKKMDKISPDFDTMYRIWECVSIFNECYMHTYSENSEHHLFLATAPKNYSNFYCMIYKENNFSIKFALQRKSESKIINLEINRNTSGNSASTCEKISFEDGTYQIIDGVDAEKFMFIIQCLMNGAKELIVYYYKNKKF
jgi:hypothetical protein